MIEQSQHRQQKDLPQYIENQYSTYEREEDFLDRLQKSFWPVACWVILFANTLIAWTAIRDTWASNYNPAHHFFMAITLGLTIAILAFIHKYILKK